MKKNNMRNSSEKTHGGHTLFFYATILVIIATAVVTIAAADTSVAWTKDIGDVTTADMSEDGSVIYAAVGSQIFVYDSEGVQQNTFTVGGNVVKLVCTADGTKAALYTDGEEVYYIDNGVLTWTQSFSAITDIDISNVGSVLVVESGEFHKFLRDGTTEYDSVTGIYEFGVLDPEDEFAILAQSGSNVLSKYILSTSSDYWARVGNTTFNTAFQDYQNLVIFYTNQTTAMIFTEEMLGSELWTAINQNIVISNSTLSPELYQYYKTPSQELIGWLPATNSAQWTARTGACAWVFDDKLWIGGGGSNDVWFSSDGITWTLATSSAPWAARYGACAWVFDDKLWIGGGCNKPQMTSATSSGFYKDVWFSSDGINWTQATSSAQWTARTAACAWVFDDKLWIGFGYAYSGAHSLRDIWCSSDGITWTKTSDLGNQNIGYIRCGACAWVFDNKLWVGGGYHLPASGSAYYLNDVWYSSDGINWVRATSSAPWAARYRACAWVYDDKLWIGGGGYADVWYSSDGTNWVRATSSAPWGARSEACAWVYDDKLWIGGGGYHDVWYNAEPFVEIFPDMSGQTWVFYNYTGNNPQYTQTIYYNARPFTGTYELRTKPTLRIYNLQTTKTLTGNIQTISLSDRGDWLGTATTANIYHDQITNSGFGTEYYAALGSTGTIYDIATANSAAMSILGQGQITDIYSMSASRVGTYTAGGAVTHVDIADKNALWAASGGEDGKVYVFSKDASSNWYLEYSSDSENPITALRMSARGEYILAGRTNSLTLYQTNTPTVTTTDFWFTLYAYKDSDSYRNAAVNVSVYSGNQWNAFAQGLTDSVGKYVIMLTAGQTYKFDVGNGEKIMIYQATPNVNSQTISIYTSPVSTAITYGASWDSDAGGIQFNYADSSGQTQNVRVKIMRTDTWETVYDQTFAGTESFNETLPVIDDTTGYKVEFSASRSTGLTRNNFFVSPSMDIIPIPLDKTILNVLFSCLLILLAGLFSYMSAIRGAIVVALSAVFFAYLGWLTIPWHWLTVAVVIALIAGFTQRR